MALTQISTKGIKDGTITGTDLATNIDLSDSQKLRLGTGNDLLISQDGSEALIRNTTGDFFIQNDAGDIALAAENHITLKNFDGQTYARFMEDGQCELYHDDSKRLETTAGGVTITGTDANDGTIIKGDLRLHKEGGSSSKIKWDGSEGTDGHLELFDDVKLTFGTNSDLEIFHSGTHSFIKDTGTGQLVLNTDAFRVNNAADSQNMITADEGGAVKLFFADSKKLETHTNGIHMSGSIYVPDSEIIGFGNTSNPDLRIFHDGAKSVIDNTTGELRIQTDGAMRLMSTGLAVTDEVNGDTLINAQADGAVELYNSNSKKLKTTASGIKITGLEISPSGTEGSSFMTFGSGGLTTNSNSYGHFYDRATSGTNTTAVMFRSNSSQVGKIIFNNSSTLYQSGSSDRTLKKNFEDWTETILTSFKNLNPQKFNFIQEEDTDAKHKGYIAQDLADKFPEAYPKDPETDKYGFNPSGMVVYLMKAIQELEAEVAALKAS